MIAPADHSHCNFCEIKTILCPLPLHLAPSAFWLSKMTMNGKCFASFQDIGAANAGQLKILTEADSQSCFRK